MDLLTRCKKIISFGFTKALEAMKYPGSVILMVSLAFAACGDRGGEYIEEDPAVPCRMIIRKDACGKIDIGNSIEWLNTLIYESYYDATGLYKGRIWLKDYNGTNYFVTDMPISEGFTGYHVYTCEGASAEIIDPEFFSSLTNRYLLWISYCPQPGTGD